MKEPSKKQRIRFNPIAKEVRTPKYKQRIKASKSRYDEVFDLDKELDLYHENENKKNDWQVKYSMA